MPHLHAAAHDDLEPNLATNAQESRLAAYCSAWNARHPVLAMVLVALLAVIVNCHPVIFCGRSYVSPSSTGVLVYSWLPLFPGMEPTLQVSAHGSDTGATMVQGVPWGFIESRSLLQHGELPLWNRYSHAGSVFLGQAVTMLGDPLQLIVIFGRGSAIAWDLKFLTAKLLFCTGFGLLVLRVSGSQPLGLIFAVLGAYCGAFFYINNHPVFFVFSYAPWILLSALTWLNPRVSHHFRWGLVWLLVNFACFNAGHVEVAVLLIAGLNLAALVDAGLACRRAAEFVTVLGRLMVGTVLFLGLTAPVWMSFLAALNGAFSSHAEVHVYQLPLWSLPGAFDNLLYLLLVPSDAYPAVAPGASLLVLAGCLLSVLRWRQMRHETFFWINCGAIGLWGGCIFGWVPASLLVLIPFLNRDGHTFTDFSYLLVIHLTLQSAYGFRALAQEQNFRRAVKEMLLIALVFAGMLAGYSFSFSHRPIPWNYFFCVGTAAVGAPLLFAYLKSRKPWISAAGWAAIILLGLIAQFRFGLYSFGDKDLLLLVGPRMVLDSPSPAIEKIKTDGSGPFRVVGMQHNLFGDYASVYGLEDIRSCDPLTSGDYMDLVQNFPGMQFDYEWILIVQRAVLAQPLLNLLNVKYLLYPTGISVSPTLNLRVTDRSDFGVVENLEVWPRAFFTDRVVSIATTGEFIQRLVQHGQHPFAALTPQEIATQPGLRELATAEPAVILAATNYQLLANSTAFEIHVPSAGVVCLTEGQARDFSATANGEPKTVLTVNRAFKGLYLDRPGDYHIVFTYRPRHWRLACSLFITATAAVIALVGIRAFRTRLPAHHSITTRDTF
jgi:hypothetical protein